MRLLLLAPLLALAHSAAFAQAAISGTAPTDADVLNRELGRGKFHIAANVTGSPLLLPYWVRGTVKMNSGTVPRPLLKYDLAGERLLWRRPTGDSLELNTSEVTEFSLNDSLRGKTYTYRRYLDAKIESLPLRTAFFEVRYDAGHAALLRRRNRVLFRGNNSPSLAGHPGDKWMETTTYFVKRTDNVVEPIRLNSKSILAALGKDKAPALTAYATREHLNLTEETDVIKLLQYYGTL
jgi:hypothetical protein